MKKRFSIAFLLICYLVICTVGFAVTITPTTSEEFSHLSPTTVATNVNEWTTVNPTQPKILWDVGSPSRAYVFYSDGTTLKFKISVDEGSTWSSGYTIRVCAQGYHFAVVWDGEYIHYTYSSGSANTPIYYRRGKPSAPWETIPIQWSPEQIAVSAVSAVYYRGPTLTIDSNNNPWIGYSRVDTSNDYPYITKSSRNDGTWTTAAGFPYQLSVVSSGVNNWIASPITLTSGKLYVVYTYVGTTLKGRLWNGIAWGSEEILSTNLILDGGAFSLTSLQNDVYVAYHEKTTHDLHSAIRLFSTSMWSDGVIQLSTTASTIPLISSYAEGNVVYAVWAGSPTADYVYYKMYDSIGWDSSPTKWIIVDDLTDYNRLNMCPFVVSGRMSLLYLTGSSPYTLRHDRLSISLLGISATDDPIVYNTQRKTFFCHNRYWLFYSDGVNMVYQTSLGGVWTTPTTIRSAVTGGVFAVWSNDVYVYYSYAAADSGDDLMFRRGLLQSDGSITWTAEVTALIVDIGTYIYGTTISVDSNGYPFISYLRATAGNYYPSILKSSTNDGTWTTAAEFPYVLSDEVDEKTTCIIPLTASKMYAVYHEASASGAKGRLWNGTAWGSEETILAITSKHNNYYSVAAEKDTIHFVTLEETTSHIHYCKRTYNVGWGNIEDVELTDSSASSPPVIAVNETNSTIIVFWANGNDLYYRKNVFGLWDGERSLWFTEDESLQTTEITVSYHATKGKMGFAYAYSTSPSEVKYKPFSQDSIGTNPTILEFPTADPYQRKLFYANTRHWAFYSDGTNMVYRTHNGSAWSASIIIRSDSTHGFEFSIWFDGIYMYYCYAKWSNDWGAGDPIMFRRGIPHSNGSITWSTLEQTVLAGIEGKNGAVPVINVDSDGYPFITYTYYDGGGYYPFVTKSSVNNGSWITTYGFPYKLNTVSNSNWKVGLTSLLSTNMYIQYGISSDTLKGRLWNGIMIGSEETISTSQLEDGSSFTSVGINNDVHIVIVTRSTYNIQYIARYYGIGWSSETTLASNQQYDTLPYLAKKNDDLIVVWGNLDVFYYKVWINGVGWFDATAFYEEVDLIDVVPTLEYEMFTSHLVMMYSHGWMGEYSINILFLTPNFPVMQVPILIGELIPFILGMIGVGLMVCSPLLIVQRAKDRDVRGIFILSTVLLVGFGLFCAWLIQ